MLQAFVSSVSCVSYVCCKCFYLHVAKVDLDVACACNGFQVFFGIFASASDVCCKCFNSFRCMLQVFHLDVAKVDLMLNMLQWDHLSQPPVATTGAPQSGRIRSHLHARGKRRRREGSPRTVGRVGGACGPSGAGPRVGAENRCNVGNGVLAWASGCGHPFGGR
jgi:hypothetical protein